MKSSLKISCALTLALLAGGAEGFAGPGDGHANGQGQAGHLVEAAGKTPQQGKGETVLGAGNPVPAPPPAAGALPVGHHHTAGRRPPGGPARQFGTGGIAAFQAVHIHPADDGAEAGGGDWRL